MMKGIGKLGPVGGLMFGMMKPMFPILFPKLLPKMMPKVLPTMLDRVGAMIPMPDYMREQMPDLMPKVMDNLMPHMIDDLVPLAIPKMIAFLRGRARRDFFRRRGQTLSCIFSRVVIQLVSRTRKTVYTATRKTPGQPSWR